MSFPGVPSGVPAPENNPRNYRALGGTTGRYAFLDTDTTISRRRYMYLQQAYGGHKPTPRGPNPNYRANITKFVESQRSAGQDITRKQAQTDPRMKEASQLFAKSNREWQRYLLNPKGAPDPLRPSGPLARALEAMGIRDTDADYRVGDTPKKGKRK